MEKENGGFPNRHLNKDNFLTCKNGTVDNGFFIYRYAALLLITLRIIGTDKPYDTFFYTC